MPIGPKQISSDMSLVDAIIDSIDKRLQDPKWIRANRQGNPGREHYTFTGINELTKFEKEHLVRVYGKSGAGWPGVVFSSAPDGRWTMTLYTQELPTGE